MEIQSSIDTSRVCFSVLLFGKGKSGKTTLAATANKPLYIDIGANLLSVSKKINSGHISYVTPKDYKELVSLVNNNGGILDPFETIILDSLTFIERNLVRPITPKLQDPPNLRNYGYFMERMYQALVPLIALSRENKKNIILIGHERILEREEKPAAGVLDVTGQLRERIPAMVDCVFRTDFVSNKYAVRTAPHEGLWMCGTQSDFADQLNSIEPFSKDAGFELIIAKLRGQKENASV